jgi:hypothetical protein
MTSPSITGLDPTQASAYQIVEAQLSQWGLGSLAQSAYNLTLQGYGSDAISLQLQQTPEYKQRFAANDVRIKNGLAALSPADYIATENSYRQVMQQYGLPSGYWDQPSDFAALIGNDISGAELQSRAQDAQAVWLNTDPTVKQAWSQYYGLSDGAAIASILDPTKALPIIQRMTTASQIGGAALNNDMSAPTAARAEYLADQGVTQAQAQKGYGQIAETQGALQQSAARFGTQWSQSDAENATLLNQGAAQLKQNQIADAEKALFSARGSADQNTNATRATGSY